MKLAQRLDNLGTETALCRIGAGATWAAQGHKVYPFHLGDINIPTPANIVEAALKAIRDGYTGYCPGAGIPALRDVIAQDVGAKRQVRYSAENVSVQPGGKPVIGKFLSAVLDPGDEALYPNPGYPIYESQIEYLGGIAVPYGYVESDSAYTLDMDRIRAAITRTRAGLQQLPQPHRRPVLSPRDGRVGRTRPAPRPLGAQRRRLSRDALRRRTALHRQLARHAERTASSTPAQALHDRLAHQRPSAPKVIDAISKLNTNAESCTTHFMQHAMVEAIPGDTSGPTPSWRVGRTRDASPASTPRRISSPRRRARSTSIRM